jgi:formate-dependent nitrite reductase cytochrome c552 subunit
MFLCEECHDNERCFHFSGSYGRCEDCGKTAGCVDCHNPDAPAPRKRKPAPKRVEVKPLALPATTEKKPVKDSIVIYDKNGNKRRRTLH